MGNYFILGKSVKRIESKDKVTGRAKYTGDYKCCGVLHAAMLTSPHAHAEILEMDTREAKNMPGVKAVLTGRDYPILTGSVIEDKPIIAIDRVRYFGETVALVVAESKAIAKKAASLIKVEYKLLPVINSPTKGVEPGAFILHERLIEYNRPGEEAFPEPDSNIANRTKIRKGDIEEGWKESEVIIENKVSFPQSDHAAMETRAARAEIYPSGDVHIATSTQGPFFVREEISKYFNLPIGKVIVSTPLVGGAYGGKTNVHLEFMVYLCSLAVDGRLVELINEREWDMVNSPVHIGLDATIRLGCTKEGILKAAEILYLFDGGAYSDRAVIISRAAGIDCTGPYRIPNVCCDSICVYTNHPYATAFRGFGHSEQTFAMERAMDRLAEELGMDPLRLRLINALHPCDTSPTQAVLDRSFGNLPECIRRVSKLLSWEERGPVKTGLNKVTAKGVACFWKTTSMRTDSQSGVILTFNDDGSINLNCGVVEIGQGTKTGLAQILAEKMKIDISMIHVFIHVNTRVSPYDWKTAASRGIHMAGRAVIRAAEDAISQLKKTASIALRSPEDDLELAGGRVFLRSNPCIGIDIKEIALGYVYPNGNAIEGQIIGKGVNISNLVTKIDPETGKGKPGTEWTLGAQIVEVEIDTENYYYTIKKAASVIDIGKVINYMAAKGQVMGGMAMGLSFASREGFLFDENGKIGNRNLRTYPLLRYGENPEYIVDFVETPQLDGPYGARGVGEHGVIGMPAALAAAISRAVGVQINSLPLIPETIWKNVRGEEDDSI